MIVKNVLNNIYLKADFLFIFFDNITMSDISTAITFVLVAIIVALSLKKYVKMSKNGCGCGCSDCPSKNRCNSKTEQKAEQKIENKED